jgi:prenyl protein peptidase
MPLVFPVPPISTFSAHAITLLFAISYVGSLYISKNARLSFASKPQRVENGSSREKESNERWRDDPEVIQARLLAVTIATFLCCAGVFGLLWHLIGHTVEVGTSSGIRSHEQLTFIWSRTSARPLT